MKKLQRSFIINARGRITGTSASFAAVALLAGSLWLAPSFANAQDDKSTAAASGETTKAIDPALKEAPPDQDPLTKEPPQEPAEDCTVCHKQRNTLVLPCNGLAFQRHIGHGDTPGQCPATAGSRDE